MAQVNTPMLVSGLMLLDLSAQLLESLFLMEPVDGFEADGSDESDDPDHHGKPPLSDGGLTLAARFSEVPPRPFRVS